FDKVPKFIHHHPKHVILTSIEFDHADIYKDLEDVKSAFAQLLVRIPKSGRLIYNAEDQNILDLLKSTKSKMQNPELFSYGLQKGDYMARILQQSETGIEFDVIFNGQKIETFSLPMVGAYNVLNATATIAMVHRLGWSMEKSKLALTKFLGVKRRQEIRGEPDGVLVIEDFAHHPTAVRETVKAVHEKYPQKRIFSVFEPRSATSRRKVFQSDYLKAFDGSYQIILAEAFDQSRIAAEDRFSSQELVQGLQEKSMKATVLSGADAIVQFLNQQTQTGDVVLIMSNGGFGGIYEKLLSTLSQREVLSENRL
ncbi:MAG TPA: Mur ligase family protein, partial [Pseudobdellovibrionaceae bacterium]|nr:Mur ligase family protein [Pseudobdellovibrionaceae bacterium]